MIGTGMTQIGKKDLKLDQTYNSIRRHISNLLQSERFVVIYENDIKDSTSFIFSDGLNLSDLSFYSKAFDVELINQLTKDN